MPTFYLQKTGRAKRSSPDILCLAAEERRKGTSLRKAADMFDVDKMTLKRYMDKLREGGPEAVGLVGYKSVSIAHSIFPDAMEKDLATHLAILTDQYHGLSLSKSKELAFEFAIRNNMKVPDSWMLNKKAGKAWWLGFKKRQNLSLRTPEATSIGRAAAFNRYNVNMYFDNLSMVLEKHKFEGRQIYNLDETGLTTVQNPIRVVAAKGTRRVGSTTSAERGELVTAVYTICASGNVLPPMLIFPRKNYRDYFIRGGPEGCIGAATPSGWINEALFVDYLDHFAKHTQCSPNNMVLLILDNHVSHISLAAIDKCKSLGIVLFTIPPKTSHRLQPLDTSIFYPFKNAYNGAMDAWIRSNPGKRVTIYDIPQLAAEAQLNAMTPRNVLSGFRSTGNWPYNRDIFTELDFAPCSATDRDLVPIEDEVLEHVPDQNEAMDDLQPETSATPLASTFSSPSAVNAENEIGVASALQNTASCSYVSPSEIVSLPRSSPRKAKRGPTRRKGKTTIYTLTPERNEIAERTKSSKAKKRSAVAKNVTAKKKLFQKKKSKKQAKPIEESSESDESIHYDDESDISLSDEEITLHNIMGEYVIVKVAGRSRALHYIARIDGYDEEDCDYEGVFLERVPRRLGEGDGEMIFYVNEMSEYSFGAKDILAKLPRPIMLGGSTRRSKYLKFAFDLKNWDLAY